MTAVDILTSISSYLASIFSDWRVVVFAGLVLAAFIWNGRNRVIWNNAWKASSYQSICVPETCWSYDARSLETFARAARCVWIGNRTALDRYTIDILRFSDIALAMALAAVSVFIWYEIVVLPRSYDWVKWAAFPCGAMAILYGVADLAEDLKLSTLLRHSDKVDRADAAATNMLTRIKFVSLGLSIIGAAVFGVIWLAETGAEKLTRRPPRPQTVRTRQ